MTIPAPANADDRFITRPLSICLDLIRFAAAMVVLVCHAAQMKLYDGWFPPIPLAQHYAVVVFFVLSGLVIAASALHRPTTLAEFAIARAARILPVAAAAIAFGTLAYIAVVLAGGSPQHTDTYGQLSVRGTLLPLVFLSESAWGAGPVWNPPYWSLCYEVWYYALFGAAVFLRGPLRIVSLAACAVLAGPRILLMLPVWLAGVTLALSPLARVSSPLAGALLLAGGIAGAVFHTTVVIAGLQLMKELAGPFQGQLAYSRFALSDFLLALAVAATFTGLRPLVTRWPAAWLALARPAQVLAGFSFTLYLFHWPMLLLAKSVGITAGDSAAGFAALLVAIIGLCALVARGTEQQRDLVRDWLRAMSARLRPHLSRAAA